jgi:hypothetical protein
MKYLVILSVLGLLFATSDSTNEHLDLSEQCSKTQFGRLSGENIKELVSSNSEDEDAKMECCLACLVEPKCTGWTLNKTDNESHCRLKGKTSLTPFEGDSDLISMIS